MPDYHAATAACRLPVHPAFTRGILANARAAAEPMGARCLPDSSSSSTARTPSCLPASGRLPWDTCLNRPPKGSLPGTTGGVTSGFPTVSWESARTASSSPAVTAPASLFPPRHFSLPPSPLPLHLSFFSLLPRSVLPPYLLLLVFFLFILDF